MVTEIKIPHLGANEDTALIHWKVKDADYVKKGQIIAEVETSKAIFEVEAKVEGYIALITKEEDEVTINDIIALISDSQHTSTVIPALSSTKPKELFENKIKLVIYGAGKGGQTIKETVDCINMARSEGRIDLVGADVHCFIDDNIELGESKKLDGIFIRRPIVNEADVKTITHIIIAISDRDIKEEKVFKISKSALSNYYKFYTAIHPKAYISPSAKIGEGSYIKAGAIIDTESIVGNHCIIDNNVTIAHHCTIGDFSHLAPGVTLGSSIEIGSKTLIGIGSIVPTGIKIGYNVIVSPGSVITSDIPDNVIVSGNPGKVIGKRK